MFIFALLLANCRKDKGKETKIKITLLFVICLNLPEHTEYKTQCNYVSASLPIGKQERNLNIIT